MVYRGATECLLKRRLEGDGMDEAKELTLDEVVSYNVRRLSKGFSVTELARRLDVGRGRVYDMRRARPGKPQRQFLWTDLVALCAALDVTLFDLVLPPAEFEVVGEGAGFLVGDWEEVVAWSPAKGGADVVIQKHVGRDGAALRLFGVPKGIAPDPEKLSQLKETMKEEISRRVDQMEEEMRLEFLRRREEEKEE